MGSSIPYKEEKEGAGARGILKRELMHCTKLLIVDIMSQ